MPSQAGLDDEEHGRGYSVGVARTPSTPTARPAPTLRTPTAGTVTRGPTSDDTRIVYVPVSDDGDGVEAGEPIDLTDPVAREVAGWVFGVFGVVFILAIIAVKWCDRRRPRSWYDDF